MSLLTCGVKSVANGAVLGVVDVDVVEVALPACVLFPLAVALTLPDAVAVVFPDGATVALPATGEDVGASDPLALALPDAGAAEEEEAAEVDVGSSARFRSRCACRASSRLASWTWSSRIAAGA